MCGIIGVFDLAVNAQELRPSCGYVKRLSMGP
jgi:hypothetical protein